MRFEELVNHVEVVLEKAAPRDELMRILGGREGSVSSVQENIQKLRSPHSVVVTAEIHPALFGGPISQLVKCLAAIKICQELASHSIEAAPVLLINSNIPSAFQQLALHLVDGEGAFHVIKASGADSQDSIQSAIDRIMEIGKGGWDAETLRLLERLFVNQPLSAATARLFEHLLSGWGAIAIDLTLPEFRSVDPIQMLPALSIVAEEEAHGMDRANSAWPMPSVTIVDAPSRRALEKYGLSLQDLYCGEDHVLMAIVNKMPMHVAYRLEQLKNEADKKIALLQDRLSAEKKSAKDVEATRHKIAYQLDKLQRQCSASAAMKEQTARRQVRRACNMLAPHGRRQQNELAAIQIPLKHSLEAIKLLHDKIDVFSSDHQLISMD